MPLLKHLQFELAIVLNKRDFESTVDHLASNNESQADCIIGNPADIIIIIIILK